MQGLKDYYDIHTTMEHIWIKIMDKKDRLIDRNFIPTQFRSKRLVTLDRKSGSSISRNSII